MYCSHSEKCNKGMVWNQCPIRNQIIHIQLNNDFPQAIHMVSHAAKEG